jgi:hypothetical protein
VARRKKAVEVIRLDTVMDNVKQSDDNKWIATALTGDWKRSCNRWERIMEQVGREANGRCQMNVRREDGGTIRVPVGNNTDAQANGHSIDEIINDGTPEKRW